MTKNKSKPAVIGIDPGLQGAFCLIHTVKGKDRICFRPMPVEVKGKNKEISFQEVVAILKQLDHESGLASDMHIFLEHAKPMAMGSTHAFNYGRGFAALEIAISQALIPVTYVEPHVWMKVLFQGISKDIRPKAQAALAAERLCPKFVKEIPRNRNGKLHEGMVDALLIAHYGRQKLD